MAQDTAASEPMTGRERGALAALGALALAALAVLAWQRRSAPLTMTAAPAPTAGYAAPVPSASWDRRLAEARQVDVNTADASQLERLPGVGPALARRIVEDREARGAFHSLEDLARVRGIGSKTLDGARDYIAIGEN